jgi:hypothetical protein
MRKERRCIRITGTRTGMLRARVETTSLGARREYIDSQTGQWRSTHNHNHHFEVTLGSRKWDYLEDELRAAILEHARRYVASLEVLVRNVPNNQGCRLNRVAHVRAGA